jgi:hypothetical protein
VALVCTCALLIMWSSIACNLSAVIVAAKGGRAWQKSSVLRLDSHSAVEGTVYSSSSGDVTRTCILLKHAHIGAFLCRKVCQVHAADHAKPPPVVTTDTWDKLVLALADLGQEKLREGLIKDEAGNDVALSPQTEQELVDYEGMLVSGAVAQRRG